MPFNMESLPTRHRMMLVFNYTRDWVLCLVCAGAFGALQRIEGFRSDFSLRDTSIQYRFATQERVPPWALFIISTVIPLTLMPLINFMTIQSKWDLHNSSLGVVLSLCLTASFTNVVKVTAGRPRPDLIDRCQPIPGSADHPVYGLSTSAICTQTDTAIMKDGFRSFFSGHSSLSFAGLTFLSLYMAGKMHVFNHSGHTTQIWLSLVPLIGASLVAMSRTMDYRHHWEDVVVGSLVGATIAYFSYRQFYPPLASEKSDHPYFPIGTIPSELREALGDEERTQSAIDLVDETYQD